jgi:hypothetical protein
MLSVRGARACLLRAPGAVPPLREIPRPEPAPGELLFRIEAAGVSFIDIYQRTGRYRVPLPTTLGQEGPASSKPSEPRSLIGVGERAASLPDGVSARAAAGGAGLLLCQVAKLLLNP